MIAPRVDDDVRAIVEARHGDPFSVLGMHVEKNDVIVRAFLPRAQSVAVVNTQTGAASPPLERIDPAGFFAGKVGTGAPFPYRLRVRSAGVDTDIEDPYRFGPLLGDVDAYLIAEGTHLRLYDVLGAHPRAVDYVSGIAFAVWAPNASRVAVVGDFNNWDGRVHPMRFRKECGVWELFVPAAAEGQRYKYEIKARDGTILPLKADPLGLASEHPPATASIVTRREAYDGPRAGTTANNDRHAPLSIYEVHLGSWRRRAEEGNRYLSYRELAEELVPYAKWMGFTHLELMPIAEYPFDGSWGYQQVGIYAPTSRFGSPHDFRAFIDRVHEEGLGVIVDWVPGHFPTDGHGLGFFDGTHLYEHADPRQGFHPDWNTYVYNHGRREVANFLECNALYWMREYGIDGLRVDAVASMLYLDYSRKAGEWIPNQYGGNANLEAIAFLRRTNEVVYGEFPEAMTAAEESTAWPMVSRPVDVGGLGFGYKWNMGWMHDTLAFMAQDPLYRQYHMNELTFGLLYVWSENYILPLSHDEVVHGKGSMLRKMPGDRWQQFANLRTLYGFMYGYPGKKMLFMGCEFGQESEWNHDVGLDWASTRDPGHAGVMALVRDLNHLYRALPALYEMDCEPGGFEWIDHMDHAATVIAFARFSRSRSQWCVVVCNFTPVVRSTYRIGVPGPGWYREAINTDSSFYGGTNLGNGGGVPAEPVVAHGREWSIELTLPPLSAMIFERLAP